MQNCHHFVLSGGSALLCLVPAPFFSPLTMVLPFGWSGGWKGEGEERQVRGLLCFVPKPFPYLDAFERWELSNSCVSESLHTWQCQSAPCTPPAPVPSQRGRMRKRGWHLLCNTAIQKSEEMCLLLFRNCFGPLLVTNVNMRHYLQSPYPRSLISLIQSCSHSHFIWTQL